MTKETLADRVRMLLPTASEPLLAFACEMTMQAIQNYCNLREMPDGLLHPAALMARGLYQRAQLSEEQVTPAVKGVSRGDTSYSFATAAEQMTQLASNVDFLTDYCAQLNAYRKMR